MNLTVARVKLLSIFLSRTDELEFIRLSVALFVTVIAVTVLGLVAADFDARVSQLEELEKIGQISRLFATGAH